MRILLPFAIATLFAASSAFGATCAEQSAEKKLAGAAKASFMKKCEADSKPAGNAACEAKAAEKKLAGAAKSSFIKKCESDAMGGGKSDAKGEAKGHMKKADAKGHASCADMSAEKKLAGAAKASFMKKCEEDAKKK